MNSHAQITQLEEEALIAAASRGDLESFNQLVLRHQNMAYHHAYALMRDPASAEDIAQESFVKAFQNLNTFRGGSFRSWLLRIVTNSAYDILRRAKRHPMQPLFPEDENGEEMETAPWLADPAASVEENIENSQLSEKIHELMSLLPDTYREVLLLVDLHQLDYMEAAETLRVPIGTVKSRLARARLQMRKLVQENLVDTTSPRFSQSVSS